MRIRLHKTTRERHLFEVLRTDGTRTGIDLETRSFLRHDLMHFVFERRAALKDSVFGRLAAGADPAQRALAPGAEAAPRDDGELAVTEILVGMLQGASRGGVDAAAFAARADEYLAEQGHALPAFVTPDFVRGVLADHARLCAQWESLRVGGVLELEATFADRELPRPAS